MREVIRVISTILDPFREELLRTKGRNSEFDEKTKLGGRENGFELIEGCTKWGAIRNSAQSKFL